LNNLKELSSVQLSQFNTDYAKNIFWIFGVVLKDKTFPDAANIMNILKMKNIGTRPFFWPMHEQPVFHKMGLFQNESHPISENIARNGFYIPSGLAVTNEQIDIVSDALLELFD